MRTLAGLSTNDLARLTGTTRQTINYLENGKTEKMNGSLLIAINAVLTKIAEDNEHNNFCLALLKLILTLLFDGKYESGSSLNTWEVMNTSDAFLAVAKLSEAKFYEDKLEKLSEIILKEELDKNGYQFGPLDGTLLTIYEAIGLPNFFSERRKMKEQLRKSLIDTIEDIEIEKGDE